MVNKLLLDKRGISLAETLAAGVLLLIMSTMLITGIIGAANIISQGMYIEQRGQQLELEIINKTESQDTIDTAIRIAMEDNIELEIPVQIECYGLESDSVQFKLFWRKE